MLSDFDLHLLAEGNHHQVYRCLGAHVCTLDGTSGVRFAVWAPNAQRVSVVGDFNHWDGRSHPMELRSAGVWELFVSDLGPGAIYKYEIVSPYGALLLKADPYAFAAEVRPRTASVVWDIDVYTWSDQAWMQGRIASTPLDAPMSIYEVHAGSWRCVPEENGRALTYRELADQLVGYVVDMGYTHIELLPISEHPFDGSWGYQPVGYYAPTSRFGTPDDFMYLVDRCHQRGIGVLLDWVPAHFPKDAHGLALFDGTHLYEHADPRQGEHQDWGTLIFNYGRSEVRNFLVANALFWLEKYHIDGLRVDAVASMLYLDYSRKHGQWLPNAYGGRENIEAIALLREVNSLTHALHPGTVTIAEESTSWPQVSRPVDLGGLGFTFKWNMGWMHDMLAYMEQDPVYRSAMQNNITFSLAYAFSENFVLPLSHDEVVHGKRSLLGKMPGDTWQQFANLRALYGFMYGHPGKKLLFMGGEFGQWREWNEATSLDWNLLDEPSHAGLQRYVRDLNRLYAAEGALHEVDFDWQGFDWIDFRDTSQSVIAFLRWPKAAEENAHIEQPSACAFPIIVVCNFTPVPHHNYRIGVPYPGVYQELLNSDSSHYWGSNAGNGGDITSEPIPSHDQPHSLQLTLPPLATIMLKCTA